ncbi:hypothetical protein PILCRDRAFT_757202 [Piloderma croceum F 1598]|uniref:Uncharacterized protein n=1 Tax=Piloderma croceum (strain F 1598) TaxID=765440 RepID=A0A0C3EF70_PILCF|nr:hypothetical protein PILCRDRAFT_757202 [Piloderma croceum F 1598]
MPRTRTGMVYCTSSNFGKPPPSRMRIPGAAASQPMSVFLGGGRWGSTRTGCSYAHCIVIFYRIPPTSSSFFNFISYLPPQTPAMVRTSQPSLSYIYISPLLIYLSHCHSYGLSEPQNPFSV